MRLPLSASATIFEVKIHRIRWLPWINPDCAYSAPLDHLAGFIGGDERGEWKGMRGKGKEERKGKLVEIGKGSGGIRGGPHRLAWKQMDASG